MCKGDKNMAIVTKPLVLDETVREFNGKLTGILENITLASAKAAEAASSANASAQSASSASQASATAQQVLRDTQLIANSGNADLLSTQNAADIIQLAGDIAELATIKRSKNLLNKNEVLSDTSISTASNTKIDAIESNPNYDLTGVIPILNGKTYYFYGSLNTSYKPHIMIYDNDGYQKAHGDMTLLDAQKSIWSYTNNYGVQARIRYSNACEMDVSDYWFGLSNDYDADVIPYGSKYKKLKEDVIVPQIISSNSDLYLKLHGKKILNYGDSIAFGGGFSGGYAGIIANEYGMTVQDRSASGSTLHYMEGRGCIASRISGDEIYPNIDYVFVNGGYNDVANETGNDWIGNLSNDYNGSYNASTLYGALELSCKILKTKYPKAKVIFIITPKIRSSFQPVWDGETASFNAVHKAIIEVCQKWSCGYVDLFTKSDFNSKFTQYYQYTANSDGIHPTEEGYRLFYVPQILSNM